ncbi:MAG: hypothetical protein KHW84_18260 [Enterobacter cloacae]|nr:hypothetical protein [Enterobacter cloacae]
MLTTLTTSVVLFRWQLLSALLMFMASTLNIRFRRSDYFGLAVISSGMGLAAACWFATGLLGLSVMDFAKIWQHFASVWEEMTRNAPPEWPMVMT